MAAGDAAMQQLAQTFANLAQNATNAAKSLKLSSEQAALLGLKFSKVTFEGLQKTFSTLGTRVSKSFSYLTDKAKAFGNALDLSDQDVLRFGKNLATVSFKKIQESALYLVNNGFPALVKAAGITAISIGAFGLSLKKKDLGGGEGVAGAAKGIFSSLSAATMGPIAGFGALTGAFTGIIDIIGKFVGALNPGIMEQLQLAFDDLFAVVGRAFVPVMAAVIPIVRTFADAMVPVIQSLMPTFKLLADTMLTVAVPVIGIFSGVLMALQPQFEQIAKIINTFAGTLGDGLMPIIDAMIPWWQAILEVVQLLIPPIMELVNAFMQLATPLLQIIVPLLVPALKMLADVVAWLVSKFAWLIGKVAAFAQEFVPKEMQKPQNLKIPQVEAGASRGAAAKGASFISFSDYGRQLMEAAFGSGANTPEMRTAEAAEKMADGIDKLVQQGDKNAPQFNINQLAKGVR